MKTMKTKSPVSALSLTLNTPERNSRAMFGLKLGEEINRRIFYPIVSNEAERLRFMQREIDKVKALKLNKWESAAVQMQAERTKESIAALDKLLAEHGKEIDVDKVRGAATRMLEMYNLYHDAINEFLVMHGYQPIGWQKNYMPHMQRDADMNTLRERLSALGFETEDVSDLPAEIAGKTEQFRPGKKWNPFFQKRNAATDKNVQYDALAGFDAYITYLSEVLYHTDDIQKLRALENALRERFASDEVSAEIAEIRIQMLGDPNADRGALQAKLDKAYGELKLGEYYGKYVTWLTNYTNGIAGKQDVVDRGAESAVGRKALNLGKKINDAYSGAVIAGNFSSVVNQTVQLPLVKARFGLATMTRALMDTVRGKKGRLNATASFDKRSTFLQGKIGVDYASPSTAWEKFNKVTNFVFEQVDIFCTRWILRTAFLDHLKNNKNASFEEAMEAADRYITAMVGSRMKGAKPTLFNQKNVVARTLTAFQLETLNFAEYLAKDLPPALSEYQKVHGTPAAVRKAAMEVLKALFAVFIFNRIAQAEYGQTPAPLDVLGILSDSLGAGWNLTGNEFLMKLVEGELKEIADEFDYKKALMKAGSEVADDIPLVNNLATMFGFIDGKLPLPQIIDLKSILKNGWSGLGQEALKVLPTWIPMGSQIKKTATGIGVIVNQGKFGTDGSLQYAADRNFQNVLRAAIFGPNALEVQRKKYLGARGLSSAETDTWRQLLSDGAAPEAAKDAIDAIDAEEKAAYADATKEGLTGSERSAAVKKSEIAKIATANIPPVARGTLLYTKVLEDSELEVFDALIDTGAGEQKTFDFMAKFTQATDETAKRYLLFEDPTLSDDEKYAVYTSYSSFTTEKVQETIDNLADKGASKAQIYRFLRGIYKDTPEEEERKSNLKPRAEQLRYIAGCDLTTAAKEEAIYMLTEDRYVDKLHEKLQKVKKAGGTVNDYCIAYAAVSGIVADKDKRGNSISGSAARKKQDAIKSALPKASKKLRDLLYDLVK